LYFISFIKLLLFACVTEKNIIERPHSPCDPAGGLKLWQFLLELLTHENYKEIICWTKYNGEFKFLKPNEVAQLWGIKIDKPHMSYELVARRLRYYYNDNIITKVNDKNFVYRFCDLKTLVGYSTNELKGYQINLNF
jgi:hypothetical protein